MTNLKTHNYSFFKPNNQLKYLFDSNNFYILGMYINDKKEGVGTFWWPDGRVYEGHWVNGKQHGYGRYTNNRTDDKYGFWANGKRERWLTKQEFDQA